MLGMIRERFYSGSGAMKMFRVGARVVMCVQQRRDRVRDKGLPWLSTTLDHPWTITSLPLLDESYPSYYWHTNHPYRILRKEHLPS